MHTLDITDKRKTYGVILDRKTYGNPLINTVKDPLNIVVKLTEISPQIYAEGIRVFTPDPKLRIQIQTLVERLTKDAKKLVESEGKISTLERNLREFKTHEELIETQVRDHYHEFTEF